MKKAILAVALIGGASASHAAELYIYGDATEWPGIVNAEVNPMRPYGNEGQFRGVTYIRGAKETMDSDGKSTWSVRPFWFLTSNDPSGNVYKWDDEGGNGKIEEFTQTISGSDGVSKSVTYKKFKIKEYVSDDKTAWEPQADILFGAGNYDIFVDLNEMTCTVTKLEDITTPIYGRAIKMVGAITESAWSIDNGILLENTLYMPYVYTVKGADMREGEYKFTIAPETGYGSNDFWIYKKVGVEPELMELDGSQKNKLNIRYQLAKGQEGDEKFYNYNYSGSGNAKGPGKNDVVVNLKDGTVSCSKTVGSGVEEVAVEEGSVEYFTLTGVRVESPAKGIYIRKAGNKVEKVVL